jgi:hypothetical protein
MLQNERYQKMYLAHMRTILDEKFLSGWYEDRARYIQGLIDEIVKNDDKKYYSYENFMNNIDHSVIDEGRLLVGIAELMEGRKEYLDLLFRNQAVQPIFSNTTINKSSVDSDSTIKITSKIDHADLAQFVYRTHLKSPFIKINMYDDGLHGDGDANDDIFGATINPMSDRIQYYLYAENVEAAKFSPEGAQYKLHELRIQTNLVINEFLARNDTTNRDQDDDYDDWIELFNNSENSISLNNYFLSDNAENFFKWQFPDTVIDALGYLIVWADEDGRQEGLHTNFKLSGEGEVIFLSNSDSQVVDEVVFGEQKMDISTGRLPNGTGAFTTLLPSFASENLVEFMDRDDDEPEISQEVVLKQNYPNPFNPITTISYQLSMNNDVELSIYSVLGQKITTLVNEYQSAGHYVVEWNAGGFSSGVYFYRLKTGKYQEIKKAILIK